MYKKMMMMMASLLLAKRSLYARSSYARYTMHVLPKRSITKPHR